MAMWNFVSSQPSLPTARVLLVGIGNSEVAAKFLSNKSSEVDGITLSPSENLYAEENHAQALKSGKYRIFVGNKYNPIFRSSLRSDYDLILDNNLASFACCPSFYTDLIKDFINRLAPRGRLLTADLGMAWAEPWGYQLTAESLTRLASESFGSVSHELALADGCPVSGCRVFSVLPLQIH